MNAQLSLRVNPENPNHHLWNNNGTWFIHYVVHPTPFTKERIRHSLGTKCIHTARAKRDAVFSGAQLADLHGGAFSDSENNCSPTAEQNAANN